MHDATHSLHHADRGITLENVSAHVDAVCALLDGIVTHVQRFEFRQLFATGNHDRHRTAGRHDIELSLGVVTLNDISSKLCHDAGGEPEILWRAAIARPTAVTPMTAMP